VSTLELIGVEGMGEVLAGDDLAAAILDALALDGRRLEPGDIVVVSSKVVSKAEGRTLAALTRDAAIDAETVRVVAERVSPRGLTRIVEARSGPVLAAAGVDASNVAPGTVLLLPADPDASARSLRAALTAAAGGPVAGGPVAGGPVAGGPVAGGPVAVMISDTAGRAWRDGQVDLAIGAAGLQITDDLRGGTDPYGNPLEVTVRALADELAAAADLVKGKLRGMPVAIVRGMAELVTPADGPGAAALLRGPGGDWFALGHVEAVRTALGAPPGTPGVAPAPLLPDGTAERLRRAVAVALAGTGTPADPFPGAAQPEVEIRRGSPPSTQAQAVVTGAPASGGIDLMARGALVQRIVAAAWAEGLRIRIQPAADGSVIAHATIE
jgi:coenzyme F420-0:L-glutamate ligase / coenzyme F420-1:gamma-L-glutamate ligase